MGEALLQVTARRADGVLRFAPAATIAVLLLPIVAGLPDYLAWIATETGDDQMGA